MSLSPDRIGNFTSSEIYNLTTVDRSGKNFGKPALTYIEEKNIERRLGRRLDNEVSARATSWGKLLEHRVHDLLGIEYRLCSSETIQHPEIDYWCGSPDFERFASVKYVCDAKCPQTLKSFCTLIDAWGTDGITGIRTFHRDGEKYYWQIVSNAILTGSDHGELIVYCPYKDELDAIRDMAANYDGPDQHQFKWIAFAQDDELPYLLRGGYYKNLNTLQFLVLQSDKDFLTECVLKAGELLVPRQPLVTC